jgi:hypothetical protein
MSPQSGSSDYEAPVSPTGVSSLMVDGCDMNVLILVKNPTSIQAPRGVPGTTRTSGRRSITTGRLRKPPIFCVGRLHRQWVGMPQPNQRNQSQGAREPAGGG